jgi:hypothetical protein
MAADDTALHRRAVPAQAGRPLEDRDLSPNTPAAYAGRMVDLPSREPAVDARAVKVGVLLAREPDPMGEWLADTTSFDAAGVDALWVDSGPEPKWDVLALTAALTVLTSRSLLVVTLPSSGAPVAELARTLETIGSLSQGRLVLLADPGQCDQLAVHAPRVRIFRRLPDEPGVFEEPGTGDEAGRWLSVPPPQGRASWRAALADAAEHGVHGLVVPADPLLLDILRNPDDPTGRRDLHLAQG